MNGSLKIVGALALTVSLFACDYVRNANQASTPGTVVTQANKIYRKVLIEDYTGHRCVNCPNAAATLTSLEGSYPNKIVPLAVHAGFFAAVNSAYPTNMITQVGTDWDNTFFISNGPGNPNGMVNRKKDSTLAVTGYPYIMPPGNWEAEFTKMDTLLADFQLKISNSYNSSTGVLSSSITTKALRSLNGTYNLVVVLTEDSITGPQETQTATISNYVFNHVLRASLDVSSPSWGTQVFNGSVHSNDSIVKPYNYTIPSAFNYRHCHVVAFVYDATAASPAYYEVLQAEIKDVN